MHQHYQVVRGDQVPCEQFKSPLTISTRREHKVTGRDVVSEANFLGVNPTWLSPNCVTLGKIPNLSVPLCPLLQNGDDDYNSSNWNCCEDEMGSI